MEVALNSGGRRTSGGRGCGRPEPQRGGCRPGGKELERGLRLPGVGVGWKGALKVLEDWVQAQATSEDAGCQGHVQGQLHCGCAWRAVGPQWFRMPWRRVALRPFCCGSSVSVTPPGMDS